MALGDYKILKETAGGVWDETTLQTEEFQRIHVGATAPADTTKLWLDTTSVPGGSAVIHTCTKTLIAGTTSIAANEFSPALSAAPISITAYFADGNGDMYEISLGVKSYTIADNTINIESSEEYVNALIKIT